MANTTTIIESTTSSTALSTATATMIRKKVIAVARVDEPFFNPCIFESADVNNIQEHCANKSGVNFDLFSTVMRILKTDYTIIPAEENDTGYKDANGTWRGIIGQLLRGEADMTATLLPIEPDGSMEYVDYSAPATYFVKAFLVQQRSPLEATVSPTFLLKTFSPNVWYCLLSSLLVFILLTFAARMFWVSKQERQPCQWFADSVMDIVRSPLSQTEPWAYPGPLRLTLNYLNVPMFFLMNFYTAYLTGTLMILGKPEDPFHGINELAQMIYHRQYTLIHLADSLRNIKLPPPEKTWSDDPEELIQIAWRWNPPVLAPTIEKAVEMVAGNKSLVFRGSVQQLTYASALSCRTKVIEDRDSVPTWLTFGFRKGDPLQQQVSQTLYSTTYVEWFMTRSYKRYIKHRQCDDESLIKRRYFPLGMFEMQSAYYLLVYGLAASVPLILLEYFYGNFTKCLEKCCFIFKKKKEKDLQLPITRNSTWASSAWVRDAENQDGVTPGSPTLFHRKRSRGTSIESGEYMPPPPDPDTFNYFQVRGFSDLNGR